MKRDYTTLLHFLRTGELGQLKPGMSEQAVYDYLGLPDETFDKGKVISPCRVAKYGCLRLLFHIRVSTSETLVYLFRIDIMIRQYPEHDLPRSLGKGWLPAFYGLSSSEIAIFLNSHSITFEAGQRDIYLPELDILFEFDDTCRLRYFFHQNISVKPLKS